jgi:hypothetical protein
MTVSKSPAAESFYQLDLPESIIVEAVANEADMSSQFIDSIKISNNDTSDRCMDSRL